MPTIVGSVIINGEEVGSVSGEYIDEMQDSSSENVQHRIVNVMVLLDGEQVGTGILEYNDYVTYDDGGQRTIEVFGNVYVDSIIIGNTSGSFIDSYGSVISISQPVKPAKEEISPAILLGGLILLLIVLSTRRKE